MANRRPTGSSRTAATAPPAPSASPASSVTPAPAAENAAPRRSTAAPKAAAAPGPSKGITVSEDARRAMIAQAAYLRAERRGFTAGDEVEDWLAAEAEVDALLRAGNGRPPQ